jgi:hypothetical protein
MKKFIRILQSVVGILVAASMSAVGQTSIFTTQTPATTAGSTGNNGGLELGTRFQSSQAGNIVGLRYYRNSSDTVQVTLNFGGSMPWSGVSLAFVDAALPPPPVAPSNLSATSASATQINLSWTNNAGNSNGIVVLRQTTAAGTWQQAALLGAGATTYQDTGRTTGTLYNYRVAAYNGSGTSAYTPVVGLTAGGSTYADWLTANSPATGFATDTDGDSVVNGIEHALGTNPNSVSAGLTQVAATATSVTFKHTLNPTLANDVTYRYEWSTDLVEWTASGVANSGGTTATIMPSPPVAGVVTVVTTSAGTPSTRLFVRLVASNP